MSKPKIKRKPNKQHRLSTAQGQLINQLTRHRELVPRTLAYMEPTITGEEHTQATYLAETIFSELEKKYGARIKMIVPIFMYERVIGGVVNYLEFQRSDNHDEKDFVPPGGLPAEPVVHAEGPGVAANLKDNPADLGAGLGVCDRQDDGGNPHADPESGVVR